MGWGIPIVDDVIEVGEDVVEVVVDAAGAVIDTVSSAGQLFADGVVSFGSAAVDTVDAAAQAAIDAGEIVVDAAGRVLRITQDVWGDVVEDITDTAEGIAVLAERTVVETVDEAAELAEAIVTEVAEVAIDTSMWAWEATNYVQNQVEDVTTSAIDWTADQAESVLHPILDPILGSQMTQDLIDSGVQFGTIYASGGEAALRQFVNERVAEEAASATRIMQIDELADEIGVPPSTVVEYGLLRGQGMDPMSALQAVGVDPAGAAARNIERWADEVIGEDGAAAAANFARDLITVYGQQAADNFASGGMDEYGNEGFDPFNPGVTSTPHDPGWETTPGEVNQLTDAGTLALGELTEAIFEPVVGQDAAEQMGIYGPRIGVAVFRTIASGGASSGELVLTAARTGFEAAAGQSFEDFVGDEISTEWADALGPEGARALGTLTETGLRLGLNYAASHAGGSAPDQNPDEDDLEAFRDAFLDLGAQAIEELTDIDPAVINRLTLHIANDEWTDEDTEDLINGVRRIVPEEHRDFYDSIHAASNGDQQGALMALQNRIPPQIGQAYQAQMVQDQALMAITGSNPMANVPILDRLGLGTEALNAIVAADETARGVEPYTRPDNAEPDLSAETPPSPYADLPLEDVVAQEMDTAQALGEIASATGDPVVAQHAQTLMAQATAHQALLASGDEAAIAEALSPDAAIAAQQQTLVQALQMTSSAGPASAPVAAQLQTLLARNHADTQDLIEANGPPPPRGRYADLPLEDVVAQEMTTATSLLAIANQTGNAAIGYQAQALMAQAVAHRQILDSGDEDAIADLVPDAAIGAQNAALSQAMGMAYAQGPMGAVAAAQVGTLLQQTQAQTQTLYEEFGPPPPPVNETLAAATAIAQSQDLARELNLLAAQAGPNAPMIASQAQALQAQARAQMEALAAGHDANGNPVTADSVIAAQQGVLANSLQLALVPTVQPGGFVGVNPQAQAVAGQLQGLLGQTQAYRDTLTERRAAVERYERTHPPVEPTDVPVPDPDDPDYDPTGRNQTNPRGDIDGRAPEIDPNADDPDYDPTGRNQTNPRGDIDGRGPEIDPNADDPDYDPTGRNQTNPRGDIDGRGPEIDPNADDPDYDPTGRNQTNPRGDIDGRAPEIDPNADDDDFEDDIMAPHLEAAPGTVRAQLDTDGDGQLSAEEISVRGISGQNAVDDGGLEWEASSSGDALTGEAPTLVGGTASTAMAAAEPMPPPPAEAEAPPPAPAPPPVEAPAPEAEAPEPLPPPPAEDSYEAPEPEPEPEPEVPEDDDGMV